MPRGEAAAIEARIDQERFAEQLRVAQIVTRVTNDELAERTGIDATTISRYRSSTYKSGPPSKARIRLLTKALGLPNGVLGSHMEIDVELMRRIIARKRAHPDWDFENEMAEIDRELHDQAGSVEIPLLGKVGAPLAHYEISEAGTGALVERVYREMSRQIHSAGATRETIEARLALEYLHRLYVAAVDETQLLRADIQELKRELSTLRVASGGDPSLLLDVEAAERAEAEGETHPRKRGGA